MSRNSVLVATLLLLLAACGGDGDSGSSSDTTSGEGQGSPETDVGSGDAARGGSVVDPPAPGEATASVDGAQFAFNVPGGVACNIASGEFSFSFIIGDNEVVLGGGGFESNGDWAGNVTLRVFEPEGEPGPVQYFADLIDHASGLAFDGNSISYSGPFMKQPPNDGSNPPPVEAGDGAVSVTCP